jgi:2-dehydro-3-deoxygluconokinase
MKIKNNTLLSIGECMVELSPASSNNFAMNFAGDSFNTAWYARRSLPKSWKVSYLTAVGKDQLSNDMVGFIQNAGIETDHIIRVDGRTVGLYMIQLDRGERSFTYWRNNSAAKELAFNIDVLNNAMRTAGVILFSGISVAILPEADRQNLYNALALARDNGSLIVFDPNLRPGLWQNTEIMCKEITRAAACADILLPSYDDEALYFGDESPEATLARYSALGAKLVVVKNGAGNILAGGPQRKTVEFIPDVIDKPVDTTAAGDAFNAGFLSSYLSDDTIEKALAAGSALSTKVICQRGALVDV